MTSSPTQMKNRRLMLIFVIPLAACAISSVAGILLGQVVNLLYLMLGDAGDLFSIPAFCGLFLITFGLSFLCSKFLKKWLLRPR